MPPLPELRLPLNGETKTKIETLLVESCRREEHATKELEVRFGGIAYTDRGGGNPRRHYRPGVSKGVFYRVLRKMRKAGYTERHYVSTDINYETRFGYTIRETHSANKPTTYMKKEREELVTDMFYNFRVQLSKEQLINKPEQGVICDEGSITRRKERWEFTPPSPHDYFHIDLTLVDSGGSYEIELEFIHCMDNEQFAWFYAPLKYLLSLVQGSQVFISNDEIVNVVFQFNQMITIPSAPFEREAQDDIQRMKLKYPTRDVHRMINYRNDPENLRFQDLMYLRNYWITDKADGSRTFLFIAELPNPNSRGMYVLNLSKISPHVPQTDRDITVKGETILPSGTSLRGTVIDAEFYGEERILAFDILFLAGRDVRYYKLPERYSLLQQTENVIREAYANYSVKHFYTNNAEWDPRQFYMDIRAQLLANAENVRYKTDGIILSPRDCVYRPFIEPRFPHARYPIDAPVKTFKWKPVDVGSNELTIDFVLRLNEKIAGNIYSYTLMSFQPLQPGRPGRPGKAKDIIPFEGTDLFPCTNNVVRLQDGKFEGRMVQPAASVDDFNVDVIEFAWIKEEGGERGAGHFQPRRFRDDKRGGNVVSVAQSNWMGIINPISEEILQGGGLQVCYKFHNTIVKRTMFGHQFRGRRHDTLIDIGSANGGDIHRWRNIDTVYAIDPIFADEQASVTQEFNSRKRNAPGTNIHMVGIDAANADEAERHLGGVQADFITSFFSVQFFFESEEKLNQLAQMVSRYLRDGGVFFGAFMDGEQTREAFKNPSTGAYVTTRLVRYTLGGKSVRNEQPLLTLKIDPNTANITEPLQCGMPIEVTLRGGVSVSISETAQNEFFAPYDIMRRVFESHGLNEVSSSLFKDDPGLPPNFTREQAIFSSLQRRFVFVKQRAEPVTAAEAAAEEPAEPLPGADGRKRPRRSE
jgi:hypothetical protein